MDKRVDTEFKLGADLEFELRDKEGVFMRADKFFPTNGMVGTDMRGAVGEIRLSPGSASEMMAELRLCINQARKQIPADFGIYAGSGKQYPLGGHIHFSEEIETGTPLGILHKHPLVCLLDTLVAEPLNSVSDTGKRASWGFGRYGFIMMATSHMGNEYRTPLS